MEVEVEGLRIKVEVKAGRAAEVAKDLEWVLNATSEGEGEYRARVLTEEGTEAVIAVDGRMSDEQVKRVIRALDARTDTRVITWVPVFRL